MGGRLSSDVQRVAVVVVVVVVVVAATQVDQAAVELVEELVCVVVNEHAWIRDGSFCNRVIQNAGDQHEEGVEHPAEKK